jgi:hypothetical protein
MNHHATTRPLRRGILLIGSAVSFTAEAGTLEKDKDPLVKLNGRFRATYAQARKELPPKLGPVIIADGDNVFPLLLLALFLVVLVVLVMLFFVIHVVFQLSRK